MVEKYLQQFDEEFTKYDWKDTGRIDVRAYFKQSLTNYGNELIDKIPDTEDPQDIGQLINGTKLKESLKKLL
jgi:hypothetical protein